MVAAFELAHRWQAEVLMPMLERLLAELLDDDNFECIGDLALLKGSRELEQARRDLAALRQRSEEQEAAAAAARSDRGQQEL